MVCLWQLHEQGNVSVHCIVTGNNTEKLPCFRVVADCQ